MATAEQVRQMRVQYPDAVVVTYVNTSAEVKAESDLRCTSANAVDVVRSVDVERPVIFVSDRNMGHYAGHWMPPCAQGRRKRSTPWSMRWRMNRGYPEFLPSARSDVDAEIAVTAD
jgi:hypothetical protein